MRAETQGFAFLRKTTTLLRCPKDRIFTPLPSAGNVSLAIGYELKIGEINIKSFQGYYKVIVA
ncbi:MAG: hypothetical protein LBV41_07010 [Cytophagaceae bacterium]|nr:hypothetical protein [Cytophagaceae bacterium]